MTALEEAAMVEKLEAPVTEREPAARALVTVAEAKVDAPVTARVPPMAALLVTAALFKVARAPTSNVESKETSEITCNDWLKMSLLLLASPGVPIEREATVRWPLTTKSFSKVESDSTVKAPPTLRAWSNDTSWRAEMVLLAMWKSPMETSPSTVREPAMVALPPTIRALLTYWSPWMVTLPPTLRLPSTPTFCLKEALPPTMRVLPMTKLPSTCWFLTVSWS